MNSSKKESTIRTLSFKHEKITKIGLLILQLCCVAILLTIRPHLDTDKLALVIYTTFGLGWFSGLLFGLFEQKTVKFYSIISMCLVLVVVLGISLWDSRSTLLYPSVIFGSMLLFVLSWRLCWTFLLPLRIILIAISSLTTIFQILILYGFGLPSSVYYALATIIVNIWYLWLLSQKASYLHIYSDAVVFILYYLFFGLDWHFYLNLLLTSGIIMICFEGEDDRFWWILGAMLVAGAIFGVDYFFS